MVVRARRADLLLLRRSVVTIPVPERKTATVAVSRRRGLSVPVRNGGSLVVPKMGAAVHDLLR